MKKALLIIGIILIIAGVLALLFAALNRFGYYNLLDGSSEQYAALRRRMNISFIAGLALAALGAACIFIRTRLQG